MIIPAPESIAFSFFNINIYWYGVTMAIAIFVSILVGNEIFNKLNPFDKKDVIISSAPFVIFSGILGARLYFCILNGGYYFRHPLEIIDIRQGGLSIHGALVLGILALLVVAIKNKISKRKLLDVMGCVVILGQAIGRWGNYFNSEAYGLPVSSQTWGLFIPEAHRVAKYSQSSLFHPTFLYESILDLFGFAFLISLLFSVGRKYKGLTFFAYLVVYAIIRFFIEQLRVDSALNVGAFPIALLVSVLMFLVGIVGICFVIFKNNK